MSEFDAWTQSYRENSRVNLLCAEIEVFYQLKMVKYCLLCNQSLAFAVWRTKAKVLDQEADRRLIGTGG